MRYDTQAAYHNHNHRMLGVTEVEWDRMFVMQQGACAICHTPAIELNRMLSLDHDHKTGEVRGLLCSRCNTAIGLFDDDPERMVQAAAYVDKP